MRRRAASRAPTKLDLAKRAARKALDQFQDDDEVGLRIFSTDLDGRRRGLRRSRAGRSGRHATANGSTAASRCSCPQSARRSTRRPATHSRRCPTSSTDSRINAVVLLTDGRNDDPGNGDLVGLLDELEGDTRAWRRPALCASSRSRTAPTPTSPCCSASPRRRTARRTRPSTRRRSGQSSTS